MRYARLFVLGLLVLGALLFGGPAQALPGTTTRVSVDSAGNQGNGDSYWPAISGDGRYAAFRSDASNLVAGDTNGFTDVFARDRQTGATTRVSVDSAGNEGNGSSSGFPAISGDGRYVAFYSDASNLVAGDTNGFGDVFVHDRQTGATTRVSVDSAGNEGNGPSGGWPTISGDGRYVAFSSGASNLVAGDTNGFADVFVHDRQTGATTRVSVDSAGNQGNRESGSPAISGDGRYVAFPSRASNLVPGDTNGRADVFIRDRLFSTTERVSVDSASNQGNGDSGWFIAFWRGAISADGRYVAFFSYASNLVPGDTNVAPDIFLRDRLLATTERVSVDSAGNQGNGGSLDSAVSADGRYVAFDSTSSNLVPADTNGAWDVFVRDWGTADRDGDGIPDSSDNCPDDWNPGQEDLDRDGLGNACDPDRDGDGVLNGLDNCPGDPNPDQTDVDRDGLGAACDLNDNEGDRDRDGIKDGVDNCPDDPNPEQYNSDPDSLGDACDPCPADPDCDDDGLGDPEDSCATTYNADQLDLDRDGLGDACDEPDIDGDGIFNASDNCPRTANASQTDGDGDALGDACDPNPALSDADGDTLADPDDPYPLRGDGDLDGWADASDNCPRIPNPIQADGDSDSLGDPCDPDPSDPDFDNDGALDGPDNCPTASNPTQADADADGIGDACDNRPGVPDADNDYDDAPDLQENCPAVYNPYQRNLDSDAFGDACDPDLDGDGAVNDGDNCLFIPNSDQADRDGDGLGDVCDAEPDVPDADNDGRPDPSDNCPKRPYWNPLQEDSDSDGLGDVCDPDPSDPDVDDDLVRDGLDNCVTVVNPAQTDTDADGVGDACDTDKDGDSRGNLEDNCPLAFNPGQENFDGDAMGDACDGDDDNDGYWDADETLKGSGTLNAGSKPEHCDGVDNDGDTAVDEQPTGANWDIDGDTVKDCLDATVDTDGDGLVNTLDPDDDGDGRTDAQERKMSTDELGNCSSNTSHDAWPPDRTHDGFINIGDVISAFLGKILNPKGYDARSDANGDGDNDIGDVIQLFGGKILTRCVVVTRTNNTGGAVDDIHIVWSSAIAEVFSARDSELKGWSNRTISGGGLILDMDRPDVLGDLASGGQLTVVVRGSSPVVSSCHWTLKGADKGPC